MNMLTAAPAMGLADFSVIAVLGYAVVFLGLILLMIVVSLVGKIFSAKTKKAEEPAPAPVVEARCRAQDRRHAYGYHRRQDGQAYQRTAFHFHQGGKVI